MPDFNVRSDSVDVEQIMEQIRARIRDKRGVDYTEQQIRELATVKLEKFLDPRGIRSDLLAEFRKSQPPPAPYTVPLFAFEDTTLFESHRGIVRFFRALLKPLLKLFFNPAVLSHVLHNQAEINRQTVERMQAVEASLRQTGDLYYELLHNLVVELTRATIEVKNMKMQVESLAGRLEFNERRARALESAVVYRADEGERRERGGGQPSRGRAPEPREPAAPPLAPALAQPAVSSPTGAGGDPAAAASAAPAGEGPGQRSRRRRRRRGRRGGGSAAAVMAGQPGASAAGPASDEASGADEDDGAQPQAEDGRDTRPEPFEHTFGSSTHPAEPPAAPAAAPSAPEPPSADRPEPPAGDPSDQ